MYYAIFVFDDYYPSGGWRDLHVILKDKEDALKTARAVASRYRNDGNENVHVVDLTSGEVLISYHDGKEVTK